ncbi:MAG: TraX family protein [Clostridiales bacterium]|nr:TraX family protein [Clostridiales bacterium]
MSALYLKIVLLIAMLCNNVALVLVDGESYYALYMVLRAIGSMTIPLASFLLVEGFFNTKSRKKYFFRLFACALAAEVPYWYAMGTGLQRYIDALKVIFNDENYVPDVNTLSNLKELVTDRQYAYFTDVLRNCGSYAINGVFTLAVSLLMLILIEKVHKAYYGRKMLPYIALTSLSMLGAVILLVLLHAEEPVIIVLFVAMFYFLRGNKPAVSVMTIMAVLSFYMQNGIAYASGAILGVLFTFAYLGQRGTENNKIKYVFYVFYPLHLFVLYLLA